MTGLSTAEILLISLGLILLTLSILFSLMANGATNKKSLDRHRNRIHYFVITRITTAPVGYMLYVRYADITYKLPINGNDLPARLGIGDKIPMYMSPKGPRMLKREYLEQFI